MEELIKVQLFLAIFLTASNIKSFTIAQPEESTEKNTNEFANEIQKYLDSLLKLATSGFNSKKLDPVDIPNTERTFQRRILFGNLDGGFQTFNGTLKGLSSLHRDGEIYAMWESGNVLKVEANMAFNDLRIDTNARFWLGKLRRAFTMTAKIKSVKIMANLDFPLTPGEQPRASSLTVREMSRAKLDVKGLGPLNWVLEGVGYILQRTLRKSIQNRLGSLIMKVINEEIAKIDLPSLVSSIIK